MAVFVKTKQFIGRDYELKQIQEVIHASRAELGIVYGRRRVGKSALLKKAGKGVKILYFEGLQKVTKKQQIQHFISQLAEQTGTLPIAANTWKEAFQALSVHIKKSFWYVVLDEFPWMASGRPELVSLIKYFWDNFWIENSKLKMILCGSVAHFMIRHVVHSQALHNRKTFEIHLQPLASHEVGHFFGRQTTPEEMLRYLLVFGGIPKYLEQIDPKKSFFQNIDELCFQKNGFFVEEFETLFKEQFKITKTYGAVVRALSQKSCSRQSLSHKLKLTAGGGVSDYLNNLENAGFIKTYCSHVPGGTSSKTRRIYLWDEWLRFYFTYMEPHKDVIQYNERYGLFERAISKGFETYYGLAFERLCLKNFPNICQALDIDWHRIKSFGPFFKQPPRSNNKSGSGFQIDILAERTDETLMVFECKYLRNPAGLSVVREIEKKLDLLNPPRHMRVEKILIAPGGVTQELEESDFFHKTLGLSALM